jgi:hypothetical protein
VKLFQIQRPRNVQKKYYLLSYFWVRNPQLKKTQKYQQDKHEKKKIIATCMMKVNLISIGYCAVRAANCERAWRRIILMISTKWRAVQNGLLRSFKYYQQFNWE